MLQDFLAEKTLADAIANVNLLGGLLTTPQKLSFTAILRDDAFSTLE